MNRYFVKTVDELNWNKIECAKVDKHVWGGEYRPETLAQLALVKGKGLAVKMTCQESNPKAVYTEFYDSVWFDSCMEFFFGFVKGGTYINCEMNSIGNSLIGVGSSRYDRKRIDEFTDIPGIKATVEPDLWSVETLFTIDMLNKVFGEISLEKGSTFYGNFFKVGEKTHTPHYGMWNPIEVDAPDFHRPEWFGEFIII